MAISAKDVMELRKATGAGMMDCKKALEESAGDKEGALDYLRKKGQKVAAKRADKDANEGFVVTMINESGDKGIVMALSCETDFVAKNDDFQQFAKSIAKIGMDNLVPTREALLAMPFDGATVEEKCVEETGKMGREGRSLRLPNDRGQQPGFLHPRWEQDRRTALVRRWWQRRDRFSFAALPCTWRR